MDKAMVLTVINDLKRQMVELARAIEQALENDGKLSAWEGLLLGSRGMALSTSIITMFQSIDEASRKEIIKTLGQAKLVMPD